jgi:hypothetical protein
MDVLWCTRGSETRLVVDPAAADDLLLMKLTRNANTESADDAAGAGAVPMI